MVGRGRAVTCPRCSGPTLLEEDQYGPYRSCLHCGWLQEAGPPDDLPLDLPKPRGRSLTRDQASRLGAAGGRAKAAARRQLLRDSTA